MVSIEAGLQFEGVSPDGRWGANLRRLFGVGLTERTWKRVLDEHAGTHQGTGDAPDERIEQSLEVVVRGGRDTMEPRPVTLEGVGAVGEEHVKVNVESEVGCKSLNGGDDAGLGP